ncbi:MAG: hypothetical protein D6816_18975 [Bacteroidetes bacterium]|nr:MAG: hypothetical protein D6816_18975 [Bacteroidota bacterium]
MAVSWAGVQRDDAPGWPFSILRVMYDYKTRIYKITDGVVEWAGTRPDVAPANYESLNPDTFEFHIIDASKITALDYNAQGLYLTRDLRKYDSGATDHLIERVNLIDGSQAATYARTFSGSSEYETVHLCANLENVYLLSRLKANPNLFLNWERLDTDLNLLTSGTNTGPFKDPNNPLWTESSTKRSPDPTHRFRPVIRPDGNIHHYNLILDKSNPNTILQYKTTVRPPGTLALWFIGGVIAVDASTNLVGLDIQAQQGYTSQRGYHVDSTGAFVTYSGHCVRGPSPLGSEILGPASNGILAMNTYNGDGDINNLTDVIWQEDIDPLIRNFVATQNRPPIHPDADVSVSWIRHNGNDAKIRICGTVSRLQYPYGTWPNWYADVDFYVAEISRGFGPSGTASVNWYVDSAYTPPGGIPIEKPVLPSPGNAEITGLANGIFGTTGLASGVGGSGIDYEYWPTA